MQGMFDPAQFLDAAITGELKKRPPVAQGVYDATIGEPKIRTWQGKEDPSKSGYSIDIPMTVQLPESEAARVGQQNIVVYGGGFLDTTEQGGIDMAPGRNRALRQYYDACGINRPGTTPRALQGRMVKVQIGHKMVAGEPAEDVKAVAKA